MRIVGIQYLEEEIFEIMDDSLDEAEDDVVAVQHVDVGRCLAHPPKPKTQIRSLFIKFTVQ